MKRWLERSALLGAWFCATLVGTSEEAQGTLPLSAARDTNVAREVALATIELDVARAGKLLEENPSLPIPASYRARLALYRGDCDAAEVLLDTPTERADPESERMLRVATACAKATAGALIVDDKKNGVWLRVQDSRDKVLAPLIAEVVKRAQKAVKRELGVELPKPVRIDLVRDLFSLSGVTGLPIEAAETTGTLAVARWGRVSMISPRATPRGFAWQDTLTHEVVHLALSRATADQAPLWLQEGIAKRVETRWRGQRPFDGEPSPHVVAYQAMQSGRSVGLDKLGPSIAMLPSPDAAAVAYAEVASFVEYWIERNGAPALELLFADLKAVGGQAASRALKSVSGYTLGEWDVLWREHLKQRFKDGVTAGEQDGEGLSHRSLARWIRLADLLHRRDHFHAESETLSDAAREVHRQPAVRWRAARAALRRGKEAEAAALLGNVEDVDLAHGAWFALHGRLSDDPSTKQAHQAIGVGLDPLFDEVACLGFGAAEAQLPKDPTLEALCKAARTAERR